MALTANGLDIPRLQELKEQLATELQNNLGVPVDTSENAVAGIINAIYAAGLSNGYELLQAIYDQRKLDSAEGINLDDLVAYTGVVRLGAVASRTDSAHFTGDEGTNVPQNAVVRNPNTTDRYLVEAPVTITSADCYKIVYSVGQVVNNTAYTITVNGSTFTYTSDADATEDEILDGLEAAFSGSVGYTVTRVGQTLEIVSVFVDVSISVSATTFLAVESVTSIGVLVSENTGPIPGPVNSLTRIVTPVVGWTAVTNPEAVIEGRNRETDEELRQRQQESLSIAGAATVDAITSALRAVSGVSAAFVIENDTNSIDADLRPPKSYEAVVSGGTDGDVAQVMWDTKPAGIETFGTVTANATDVDGQSRQVKFSRPVDRYIHVEVTYTLYDEESFPSDGEDGIKQAILDKADTLGIDEDVIPKRFYGPIYTAVPGIEDLTVGMAVTPNPGDTPASYSENPIPIGFKEVADFDISRITVISP